MAEIGAEYIEELRKTGETFEEILKKDSNGMVISQDERATLQDLLRRNEKVLKKLERGEFTVAIIGLEKAGKSTLGNALLKNYFLPEYTERCTYTTTEIRAGESDSGEIVFYSRAEFERNFRALLDAVHYENRMNSSGMDISWQVFKQWWKTVEENDFSTFREHDGTTVRDIQAILEGGNKIREYLDRPPEMFVGAEKLESDAFQQFITGIESYGEGPVERSPVPYAVKKVNILSTQLGDMKDIVLYDVPGFDSPTDLHKKQTAEMLQAADIIILVVNAGDRPNLTGQHLSMMQKQMDEDGIRLSEKTFVFGNKLDTARNPIVAKANQAALGKDVLEKHIVNDAQHIVCGSAKAHLESMGKLSKDEKMRGTGAERSVDKIKDWDLPTGDGIKALWGKMLDYYNHERRTVLGNRARNTLKEARALLEQILAKHKEAADGAGAENKEIVNYGFAFKNRLPAFEAEAHSIAGAYRDRIRDEAPFSNLVKDNIEEIYPLTGDDFVMEVERKSSVDVSDVTNLGKVESDVRNQLHIKFTKEIVKRTADETLSKEEEIYDMLAEKFLEIMEIEETPHYEDLKASTRALFDDILKTEDGDRCRFNTLVERFTTDPIEALIRHPLITSGTRLDKVLGRDSLPQFFSLAAYYVISQASEDEGLDLNDEEKRMQLFSQILTHEELGAQSEAENETGLRAFFEENKEQLAEGAALTIELLPLARWAKLFARAGMKLFEQGGLDKKVRGQLEDALYKPGWDKKNRDEKLEILEVHVKTACSQVRKPPQKDLSQALKELHSIAQAKAAQRNAALLEEYSDDSERNAEKRKQMIDEINEDIEILHRITQSAVVAAIGLEKAFNSVILNNVNLIREHTKAVKDNKFDRWFSENMKKIKEREFARIDENTMQAQTKKEIIRAIDKWLDESAI